MADETENEASPPRPSWLRWPPNCCETCVGWEAREKWVGTCVKSDSLECGTTTDSRFRCPAFQRRAEV